MCSRILAHWPRRRRRVAARYRASRSAAVQALELRITIPGSGCEEEEEEEEAGFGGATDGEGLPGTPQGKMRSFSFFASELGRLEKEEEAVSKGCIAFSCVDDDAVGLGYENTQTKGATIEGKKEGRAAFRTWEQAFEKE